MLLLVAALTVFLAGCQEKPKTEPIIEKSKTSVREAGEAIKDAAVKTGNVVENAADKAWEGIKKGAQQVTHVATNVASEVKAGAVKVGEKVKEATK